MSQAGSDAKHSIKTWTIQKKSAKCIVNPTAWRSMQVDECFCVLEVTSEVECLSHRIPSQIVQLLYCHLPWPLFQHKCKLSTLGSPPVNVFPAHAVEWTFQLHFYRHDDWEWVIYTSSETLLMTSLVFGACKCNQRCVHVSASKAHNMPSGRSGMTRKPSSQHKQKAW